MRSRRIIYFIISLIIILGVIGCSGTNSKNGISNRLNGGLAFQSGEWIYYKNSSDKNCLYRIKTDGNDKQKLSTEKIFGIVGGNNRWIVYQADTGFFTYDGLTEGHRQLENTSDIVDIEGDWVYFIYEDALYKVRLDGSNKTKLMEIKSYWDEYSDANIINEYIYYINYLDDSKIYRMKLDGSEKAKLNEEKSFHLNVTADWIFYSGENGQIYRMKRDGTEKTKIGDSPEGGFINVKDDWIYYEKIFDGVYKIKIDGSSRIKLVNCNPGSVNVVGEWIYYPDSDQEQKIYKMKLDGSENQVVY